MAPSLPMTEYSLATPFRTMVTFTRFDGGAGAGGGAATGFTGSGMLRPISRSPMRRFGSRARLDWSAENQGQLADIRCQQNFLRLLFRDFQRDCPGNCWLFFCFVRDLVNCKHF